MSILNVLSLYEMEEELEKQLKKPNNNIRILGDMNLSGEDYQYLLLKMRGLEKYHTALELCENFRLSILTFLIFSMRREKRGGNYCMKLKDYLMGLEQHQIRYCIEIILQAFDEYGLHMFGMEKTGTIDDLLELLVVHTGIPEELQDDFCHLLDDSLMYGEFSSIEERFLYRLPAYMKNLYRFVRKDVLIQMMDYSREMFRDYRINGITRREAYAKYPLMSSNLMKACFHWCERQELYARSFG